MTTPTAASAHTSRGHTTQIVRLESIFTMDSRFDFDEARPGLISIGVCATLSLLSSSFLVIFMITRSPLWSRVSVFDIDQNLFLIFNLLISDLLQASSLTVSFRWLELNAISAAHGICRMQAGMLIFGDLSSGIFTVLIAIHTMMGVLYRRKMSAPLFFVSVGSCWLLAIVLTIFGPILYSNDFFAQSGPWCWIARRYEAERLALHLAWIFIFQISIIVVYVATFLALNRQVTRTSSASRCAKPNNQNKIARASWSMILYPLTYVICTLPVAAGRLAIMVANKSDEHSITFYSITGSLLASSGWIDAILYAITRNVLVSHGSESHTLKDALTLSEVQGEKSNHAASKHACIETELSPWPLWMKTCPICTTKDDNLPRWQRALRLQDSSACLTHPILFPEDYTGKSQTSSESPKRSTELSPDSISSEKSLASRSLGKEVGANTRAGGELSVVDCQTDNSTARSMEQSEKWLSEWANFSGFNIGA